MIFFSCRTTWWGGLNFGNRYFAVLYLVSIFALGERMEKTVRGDRRLLGLWATCFGVSIVVHALGGYFLYPGSFFEERPEETWQIAMHPAVDLFRRDGSLGALGIGRYALGAAILTLAVPIAAWNARYLRAEDDASLATESS
jgi:hypothetical protein